MENVENVIVETTTESTIEVATTEAISGLTAEEAMSDAHILAVAVENNSKRGRNQFIPLLPTGIEYIYMVANRDNISVEEAVIKVKNIFSKEGSLEERIALHEEYKNLSNKSSASHQGKVVQLKTEEGMKRAGVYDQYLNAVKNNNKKIKSQCLAVGRSMAKVMANS